MKPTPRDVQWLVAQLDDNKRRLKNLENRKPGLAYSSIEDGAIREFDRDGVQGSQIGKQPDGTHGSVTLNGPKPPMPSMPTATAIPGIVEVRWNGKFSGGAVSPLDLKNVSAYVVRVGEVLDLSKAAGVMTGELGDVVQAQREAGVYNVYLVSWSKAGRFSDAAGPVPVLVSVPADADAIQGALDEVDKKYNGVITESGKIKHRLETAESDITAAKGRLTNVEATLAPLPGQMADAKTKIEKTLPNAIADAKAAAEMALLIAPVSTAAPVLADGAGRPLNSVWTRIDASGNEIGWWRWTASGWVTMAMTATVIPNLAASKITSGTVATARLNAQEIAVAVASIIELNADRITAGQIMTARLNAIEVAAATAQFIKLDVSQLVAVTGTMSEAVITRIFTDMMAAHKITSKMIAVGDFQNLATLDPIRGETGGASQTVIGDYVYRDVGAQNYIFFKERTNTVPFTNADRLRIQFKVIASADRAFSVNLWAYPEPENGAATGNRASTTGTIFTATTTEQTLDFELNLAPLPNTVFKSWTMGVSGAGGFNNQVDGIQGIVGVRDVRVYRKNGGEMVIDGSLKSVKIDTDDLAANTGFIADLTARIVKADMFVGKEFHGGVFTGAVFQSPGGGAGFQLTENGYTSRDEAGNVTVHLPADGSPAQFKGDVEAQSLTASGRMSMQAPGNEISSGATLILEAGVTPPLTPPTVGTTYTSTPLAPLAAGESAAGLAYAQGLWWRGVRRTADSLGRIEGLNSSGVVTVSQEIFEDPLNGLTAIGNTLYLLGTRNARPAGERWVVAYSVTTTAVTSSHFWQYTDYGTGAYQPGIGVNGSNVMIGQVRINGPFTWRTYNSTTGALVSQIDSAFVRRDDVVGIVQTAGDFGATRIVVAFRNAVTEAFTTAGVNTGPSESWYSAGRSPNLGIVWQGGAFWQYAARQGIVKHSAIKDPTGTGGRDTDDWWIAATWHGAGGTETTMGPPRRFTFMRRSELQLAAGTLPVGATGVRFYLGRKATFPTRTDMRLIATVTGSSGRIATLPASWATQANPPATNTFSSVAPGLVRSRADNFQVDGAGAGKWGPLTFHPDGTMTSNAVPAWIPITSFQSGCTVGDFGFVPTYRAWPDGKVEMRGVIKGTLDVSKPLFTLPSAVRAVQPVNLVASTSSAGGGPAVMRAEFGAVSNPDVMTIYPQGVTRSWVSLDGLYYYQS